MFVVFTMVFIIFFTYILNLSFEKLGLFNLRGSDVKYNPVFFAYALVTKNDIILYIDENKLSSEVKGHLGSSVKFRPYNAVFEDLRQLNDKFKSDNQVY
jgi:Xaa-Pro aminopeptidase